MQWWQLTTKALTPEECKLVIDTALAIPERAATVGHGGSHSLVDTGIRRSKVRWIPRHHPHLYTVFTNIERIALMSNSAFGFDLSGQCGGFTEVQFTEYHAEEEGHYGWHEDNNWKGAGNLDRKMSMVIQLSDPSEYDGGQLELHNDPLEPNKFTQQGDCIMFPSFNRHRVTPVTRGVRYSLVTWFVGPRLR